MGPVPYDRFSEVNAAKNTLSDENAQLKEHISLLSNQQPAQQAQQPAPQAEEGLTMQVMKQMGVDQEYATPAEMAKVLDTVTQIRSQQTAAQNQSQQFMTSHADFENVVGVNDPATGRFTYAPPLLRALQSNPQLVADLRAAGTGANRLAYMIAVNDPGYQKQLAEANKPVVQVQSEAAEAAITNAQAMPSISAIGANGIIDKTAQIQNMSDAEFRAYKEAIIARGGVSSY